MTTSPGAAVVQVPPGGGYRIDPARSTVTFSARHLFGLRGLTGQYLELEITAYAERT